MLASSLNASGYGCAQVNTAVSPAVRLSPLTGVSLLTVRFEILSKATDQDGKPFQVIKVPMPSPVEREVTLAPKTDMVSDWNEVFFHPSEGRKAGDKVTVVAAASYLNFIITNDYVLVPSFVEDGTPQAIQDKVRDSMISAFPGRTIEFVNATPFTWNGGGPHCATLNEPRH